MLTEIQLDRYSDVLIWGLKTARKGTFSKNDTILIRYQMPARPLAEILYAKILAMGMNPIQRVDLTPVMEHNFFKFSNNRQLTFEIQATRRFMKI